MLASKEKVFAKWQQYIEKSEQMEVKEGNLKRFSEQLSRRETELDQKASLLEEKQASLV